MNIDTYTYLQTCILNTHTIRTTKELDAALSEYWNEVPPKYKLEL